MSDQEVEGEGLQNGVDERADEGADRVRDPADDGDDEDVDRGVDAGRARRDFGILPHEQHPAERGDERSEGVGGDPMRPAR